MTFPRMSFSSQILLSLYCYEDVKKLLMSTRLREESRLNVYLIGIRDILLNSMAFPIPTFRNWVEGGDEVKLCEEPGGSCGDCQQDFS